MWQANLPCAVVAVILTLLVASCSPPDKSKKDGGQTAVAEVDPNAPLKDGGWEWRTETDALTDKTIYYAEHEMHMDDGHNGVIQTQLKYMEGSRDFTMMFGYFNDIDKAGECQSTNIRRTPIFFFVWFYRAPLKARNEHGSVPMDNQLDKVNNCNAVAVAFSNANPKAAEAASAVLSSADFRVQIPLENTQDAVVKMNFRDNAALRRFAETVTAKIDEVNKPKAAPPPEPLTEPDAPPEAEDTAPPQTAAAEPATPEPAAPSKPAATMRSANAEPADGASFDCAHAGNDTERTICTSSELGALDSRYAAKYTAVLRDLNDQDMMEAAKVREAARAFLRRRNACAVAQPCIAAAYRDIIAHLNQYAAAP